MQAILPLKTGDTVRGLRVLQVIPTLDLKAGGPVEGAIQQGQEMSNHGHSVDTVTLDLPGSPIDRRFASTGVFQLGPRYSHFAFSPSLQGWLRQNAGAYDVIIIHGMWQYHGFAVWKVAGELGVPYVIFLHGMLDPWFARRYQAQQRELDAKNHRVTQPYEEHASERRTKSSVAKEVHRARCASCEQRQCDHLLEAREHVKC